MILCIDEIGAFLVLVPAVGWLFWAGDAGWAVLLLVWSVPVLTLYNILPPVLIRKGADLSLLKIFAGRPPHRPRACPLPTRHATSCPDRTVGCPEMPRTALASEIISPPERHRTRTRESLHPGS